jgi:hypothetical protein
LWLTQRQNTEPKVEDIARIAAMKTLTRLGVSATAAAQITGSLQAGPTAEAWKQALVQAAPHIYVFLAGGGVAVAVHMGNDENEVGRILKRLHPYAGLGLPKPWLWKAIGGNRKHF